MGRTKRPLQRDRTRPPFVIRFINWVLDILPGLARPKVVAMACLAVAVAFAFVVLVDHWMESGPEWAGLIALPIFVGAVCCLLLAYWLALSWIFCGSVCSPATALAELPRGRRAAFVVLTMLPVMLFFRTCR